METAHQERIFQPSLFKDYLKSKLVSVLASVHSKINSRKLIMLDPLVRIAMNFSIDKKTLTENGVPANNGTVLLNPVQIDPNIDQVLIFMMPTPNGLKTLKELVKCNDGRANRKYYVYFCPKRTIICKQFIDSQNLGHVVQINDFTFDLLPLDIDLYSLQIRCLRDVHIEFNPSIYSIVAQSINRLQCVYGKIHNIFGKGKAARYVYQILKQKQSEVKVDQNYGDIQSLIILDRSIDFVTPLMKQLVYQGLIDDFFGITGNIVKIPSDLIKQNLQKKSESAYTAIQLSSENDYVYEQIRSLPFEGMKIALRQRGQQYNDFKEQTKNNPNVSAKAEAMKRIKVETDMLQKHLSMQGIVGGQMKTISFHKELILQQNAVFDQEYHIVEYMQNLIPFEIPLSKLLPSICLQSILDKGIYKKIYPKLCQDIVYTYGMQHIVSLTNLSNVGLLTEQGLNREHYRFNDIKKEFQLTLDTNITPNNPQDPCFAYGGYTPVSVKLVKSAITSGWRGIEKGLGLLPGQTIIPANLKECRSHPRPAVVVYFVGGVTYGEVAALRLLGKLYNKEIIIATNEMLNAETMIRSFIE